MLFIRCFYAEMLKTRRSFAFWLSLIGASLTVVIMFLVYFFKPEAFIPEAGQNPWTEYIDRNFGVVDTLLLPLYVILVVSLSAQLEFKHNMWKHLYTLPVSRAHVFFSKLGFIFFLVAATHLLFAAMVMLTGYLLGLLNSDLLFLHHSPDALYLLELTLKTFISTLGILGFQYWLSLRIKNYIIPISIGFALLVAAIILANGWNSIEYYPYAYPLLNMEEARYGVSEFSLAGLSLVHSLSLLYFAGFSILAFWDLQRRNVDL